MNRSRLLSVGTHAGFALLAVLLVSLRSAGPLYSSPADQNPVVAENQQTGTDAWRLPIRGDLLADDTGNQIKGYASSSSVNVGQSITFYVTVNPAASFTIDIYRMGWYGGRGGRLIQHIGPLDGVQQPTCPVVDQSTHLVVCSWSAGYALNVPSTWVDGIYFAVLTNAATYQNYVPFVVRNDLRTAALLYQESVNTFQAYNPWGGYSLYDFNSTGGHHADKVSFDRPYALSGGGDYFSWEVYMVQWLEQKGYDVTYSTDVDTDLNPRRLVAMKGFLSVGHDEYWTKGMYDAAQNARDAGVSLGFFGADTIYWQARLEPSAIGGPDRVLVCYKTNESPNPVDPITATNPALTTTLWRAPALGRPEQSLVGVQFSSQTGTAQDQTVPYVVSNSTSWVYANTGFNDGDAVPGIVGYETDRLWPDQHQPDGEGYTLLSRSPYVTISGANDVQNAAIYQATSGAWVFSAGTMAWSWALSRQGYVNTGLQKATSNILDRMVGTSLTGPATPEAGASAVSPTPTARPAQPGQPARATPAVQPSPAPPTISSTAVQLGGFVPVQRSGGNSGTGGMAVIVASIVAIAAVVLGAAVIAARRNS